MIFECIPCRKSWAFTLGVEAALLRPTFVEVSGCVEGAERRLQQQMNPK